MSSTKSNYTRLEKLNIARDELLQLSRAIFSLSLDETLNQIITIAAKITEAEQGNIFVYERKSDTFVSRGSIGVSDEKLVLFDIPFESDTHPSSITEWVIRNRKTALISDLRELPWSQIYQQLEKDKQSLSELAIPIQYSSEEDSKVIGVINLESSKSAAFDQDHQKLVERLAFQAAVAINIAQHTQTLNLIREIDHKISSTFDSKIILEEIANGAMEFIGSPFLVVYSLNERTGYLVPRAIRPTEVSDDKLIRIEIPPEKLSDDKEKKGIVQWTISRKKPALIKNLPEDPKWKERYIPLSDEIQIRSELVVPILWGENKEVFGAINLESPQANAFDEDDQNTLQLLAGQAAIALHNAWAYQREKSNANALEIIRKIDAEISELSVRHDLDDILNRVADGLQRLISSAEMLNIFARRKDRPILDSKVTRGFPEESLVRLEIPLTTSMISEESRGVVSWVVRHKQNALIRNSLTEKEWEDIYIPLTEGKRSRSELVVPVTWGSDKEILGVINLESYEPNAFNEQDLVFVELLAGQVAIVIHNMEVESKRIQEKVESERMDMLKLFAITSAHRMANDVGTIPVAAQEIERLIEAENPDRESIIMHAQRIKVDSRRLMDQAKKMRKPFAVDEPEEVDVHDSLRRAVEQTAKRFPDLEISVELAVDPVISKANFLMLTDSFMNLTENAAEAMSGQGKLTITSNIFEDNDERRIKINITDTGPGIPPKLQQRLFDPFFSTKKDKGMGIGLWWTRSFLKQETVGGDLKYQEAKKGERGSTFSVTLPIVN